MHEAKSPLYERLTKKNSFPLYTCNISVFCFLKIPSTFMLLSVVDFFSQTQVGTGNSFLLFCRRRLKLVLHTRIHAPSRKCKIF